MGSAWRPSADEAAGVGIPLAADEEAAAPPRNSYDNQRKRRELTDMLSAQFAKAWHPHQHVGLDDAPRPTRHQGRRLLV